MAESITQMVNRRGGARAGAGRPSTASKILHDPRYLQARGIDALSAQMILSHLIDERRAWQRVFETEDDRVLLSALIFLTSMRDGKPAQKINVTSSNLNVTCDISQIENARAIAREITGMLSQSSTDASAPTEGDATEEIRDAPSNGDVTFPSGLTSELRPMLPAVGGAEKGGR